MEPEDAAGAGADFDAFLRSRGIDPEGDQQTKTRAALRYFTDGARQEASRPARGSAAPGSPSTRGPAPSRAAGCASLTRTGIGRLAVRASAPMLQLRVRERRTTTNKEMEHEGDTSSG